MIETRRATLKIGGNTLTICNVKGVYPLSKPTISITVIDGENPNLKEILNHINEKILPWQILLPNGDGYSGIGKLYAYSIYRPWPRTDYTPRTRLRLEIEGKLTFSVQHPQ